MLTRTRTSACLRVQLLGIDPGGAVAYLVEALSGSSPAIRLAAAYALDELEVVGSVPSPLNALSDPNPAMRSKADEALGKPGDGDSQAVPHRQAMLDHHDSGVRWATEQALKQLKDMEE